MDDHGLTLGDLCDGDRFRFVHDLKDRVFIVLEDTSDPMIAVVEEITTAEQVADRDTEIERISADSPCKVSPDPQG